MLNLALTIATKAHKGQVDKGGKDYIQHPLYVASLVHTEEEKAVALLHDVIEDSLYTEDDLLRAGLPLSVVTAVRLLTKDPSQSYQDYLSHIKQNYLARKVKIADLTHNSDLSRLHVVTEADVRRKHKYEQAIRLLMETDES